LAAAFAVLGLGAAGNAAANAYAISYTDITRLTITPGSPNVVFFLPSTDNSIASATLDGSSVTTGGTGFTDAPVATRGAPAPANNLFSAQGQLGTAYAVGDAWIPFRQASGDAFTQAIGISEANIPGVGSGSAFANNSSATTLSVNLVISAADTLTFAFDAAMYLNAFLDGPPSFFPSQALAGLTGNINIFNNNTGLTVFNWSPDGAAGGISGGVETLDPWSLNATIARNFAAPGNSTYDPLGNGAPNGLPSGPAFGAYAATTNVLSAGSYTLNLSMTNTANVTRVPEPATLGLIGLALAGLAGVVRRRHSA
jgi:hypothetical protein